METLHLKSGNFLLDFLDVDEDCESDGVTVLLMWMGGVKTRLVGGWGLKVGKDEVLDRSLLLLLWTAVGADSERLSWCFWASSSWKDARVFVSFTVKKQKHESHLYSSVSYLLSEALSQFVSRGRVALGFLGQLSSGYVSAGVETSCIGNWNVPVWTWDAKTIHSAQWKSKVSIQDVKKKIYFSP